MIAFVSTRKFRVYPLNFAPTSITYRLSSAFRLTQQATISNLGDILKLDIKMFADGADIDQIRAFVPDTRVAGFTTNPTLMRRAGVANYTAFASEALSIVAPRPISFEVFTDDLSEMITQAERIASWGENVYVKIPVTNTRGESTAQVVNALSAAGVRLNVTALLTEAQIREVSDALNPTTPSVVSVFAGRIADAGVDPVPIMRRAAQALQERPMAELLWASPREVLNVIQAQECGCQIITMTTDLWTKLGNLGKDLGQYSLETVKMLHEDAKSAGYSI